MSTPSPQPPQPESDLEPTPEEAIALLWEDGDLEWKLTDVQREMRQAIADSDALVFVIECSRRIGKTFLACVLAVEQALQLPGSQVRFAAPTAKNLRKIVSPIFGEILKDCPNHLRPAFNAQEGVWTFPNGSQIHMAGVDSGNWESLRGTATDLAIVDEAAFCDSLTYGVQSVLIPTLLTTDGRALLISTPPSSPAHDFVDYVKKARTNLPKPAYFKRTIFDAKHIRPLVRDKFCSEAGGPQSTTWKREYLCEHVTDAAQACLPEFQDVKADIVKPAKWLAETRPAWFIPVVVCDVGFKDLTFTVFGYYDFKRAVAIIEAEYVVNNRTASAIATQVRAIAEKLWTQERYDSTHNPVRHLADAPPIVIGELSNVDRRWSGIAKTQTDGPYMQAAVNDLRTRLQQKEIWISDDCPQLLAHLEYAVWDKSGTDFQRMDRYGHFDGLAAAAYFTKNIDRNTNPFPKHAAGVNAYTHWLKDETPDPDTDALRRLAMPNRVRRRGK